ncbi:MAG: solute:sodium symporter family transporter [Lentisphaeraceae bacterium]|nr:solute:sodium symporter family transporter [Lentisphaeraceae bacterium]
MQLLSFLFFTFGVLAFTMFITRKHKHDSCDEYFLGGRSLTAGFIAGSLMLTNLSTEQLVGLNGAAFTHGLSVMAWEVIAAISLVVMALYFLPKFLRSGISTIPQFLEVRFGSSTRKVTSIIFIFAYTVILLPLILYTGATGMTNILNLSELTGFTYNECIWGLVLFIGILGSFYAIFGGLKTVAISDTINGFGLLIGGIAISYFGLRYIGGGEQSIFESYKTVTGTIPEKFNSISQADGQVPFFTLFSGVLLLNLFYWCTNQQIIQRTFGAVNLAEGQKGVLLAGGLKVLAPLILVLPGLLAFYLYKNGELAIPENGADHAYGLLVQKVMPGWMTGFFSAALLGAILSSFNSALNSTCTLFSLGVYQGIIKKNATDEEVVKSGKYFGWIIAIFAMAIAPMLIGQDSIFGYLQTMNAIYFVPIFAVVLVGLLTKRVPEKAANAGLLFAFITIIAVYFVPGLNITDSKSPTFVMHNFHFIAVVLLMAISLMLIWGKVSPLKTAWVHDYSGHLDMTPWKLARPVGLFLIFIVLAIYISFADLSVIGETDLVEKLVAGVFIFSALFAIYKFTRDSSKISDTPTELISDEEEALNS